MPQVRPEVLDREEQLGQQLGRERLLQDPPGQRRVRHREHRRGRHAHRQPGIKSRSRSRSRGRGSDREGFISGIRGICSKRLICVSSCHFSTEIPMNDLHCELKRKTFKGKQYERRLPPDARMAFLSFFFFLSGMNETSLNQIEIVLPRVTFSKGIL